MMLSMFQRILGLQWGWQSVLLVCDGQCWSSQGCSGSSCQTHTPAVLCCPLLVIGFTATLGLVFQATLLRGNYLQRAHQQRIWWGRPWWCQQRTGRCWCQGRPPAYRGRSGSQTLWSWTQDKKDKHNHFFIILITTTTLIVSYSLDLFMCHVHTSVHPTKTYKTLRCCGDETTCQTRKLLIQTLPFFKKGPFSSIQIRFMCCNTTQLFIITHKNKSINDKNGWMYMYKDY